MPQLFITFKGICTHLLGTHRHLTAPRFDLSTGTRRLQHRVVLANSDLIGTHIDIDRRVVRHVPKMRILGEFMTDCLKPLFDADGEWYERVLKDVAVTFENIDDEKGKPFHDDDLRRFPSLWGK